MTPNPAHCTRRRFLVGSAASALAAGCGKESTSSVEAEPERRDVPLRLALLGAAEDSEPIGRGWAAVTEQSLDIQIIELNRADAASLGDQMLAATRKSDLVIYPLALVAQASLAEVIVPFSSDDLDLIDQFSGNLYPALRNGAAKYAGEYFASPLGAPLPALLSVGEAVTAASWDQYDQLVADAWGGMAAEPSAPGWAGAMFLWRTASERNWLFNRDNLQPVVDTQPYVQSLDQMVRTHARYRWKHQTPGQIWSALGAGELKGGIGFPRLRNQAEGDIQMENAPGVSETSRVLLDPFSTVISISANCRQSVAAKRFVQWISGGEGSASVRQQVSGMTNVRSESMDGGSQSSAGAASGYDRWLASRLKTPVTMPTLQILRAGEYYAALDQQVGRALDGQATPEKSLTEVARQWQAITEEVGVEKQSRAWRRAQGLRA